jgi:hypothetical protein
VHTNSEINPANTSIVPSSNQSLHDVWNQESLQQSKPILDIRFRAAILLGLALCMSVAGYSRPTNRALSVSATSISFGNVTVGKTGTAPLILSSTGTAPVTIYSVSVAGSLFSATGATLPLTLNPGQSATLNVQFYSDHVSSFTGILTIRSNSSISPTAVVNLRGSGVSGIATLSVSATNISFGNVTVGKTGTAPLILSSTGTAPVTISSVSVAGSLFSATGVTLPLTLNPGQSATLNVQFYSDHVSSFTGILTITSNSSVSPTAVVNLSGSGVAPLSTLGSLSCNPGYVTGAGTAACSVTLNGAAPSGGLAVNLASNNAAVKTPSTITIPANATSASFTVPVSAVTSAQVAQVTATAGSVSTGFSLQLNPAAAVALTINANSVSFGSVVVNTPVTQPVTLTSTGTAPVTVSAASVTGTGFTLSGSTFPTILNPGQTMTLNVQFDPTTTGTDTGQLTITSNSATNATALVSLSGTGMPHEIALSWNAPTGTSSQIAAYNVYRSPCGKSSYQRLNASTTAEYTDNIVQSGTAYDYIVKSVDASGMESAPSNMTTVTIP